MFSTYIEVREWLEGYIPLVYGKEELGLSRIENLLRKLGDPQKKFKSIHVGGTSGKGSTAFYIARLLQIGTSFLPASARSSEKPNRNQDTDVDLRAVGIPSAGATRNFKVGLHVSPHLVDIRERMQINGLLIPMRRFIGLANEVSAVVEAIKRDQLQLTPSYFEILVATSFLYFAEEKVDWAVVEVGLGGRLDATNVLLPEVSVITNVGLDHTEILGETVEKIAAEKSGIIKKNVPIITGASGKALEVIKRAAKAENSPLITLDTQGSSKTAVSDLYRSIKKQYYSLRSHTESFASWNQNMALLTVLSLKENLDTETIKKAFFQGMPGRLEQIDENVVLDGAHNSDKIRFLIESISQFKISNLKFKITLVVAFKKGKHWKKMIDLLIKELPVIEVIATEYQSVTDTGKGSAVLADEIADYSSNVKGLKTKTIRNSQEAVLEAVANKSDNELVLITGSLYLIGEARTMWQLPEF